MQTTVEIGTKIAQARKLKNLSQTELASLMSITSQAVGKWERGESMPDIIAFGRLAAVLGVDLNYFSEGAAAVPPIGTPDTTPTEKPIVKAPGKNGRDMSSGVWKDADFSGLTGLGSRFNTSDIQNCKFLGSDLSTLTLNSNNLKNNDFSRSDFRESHITTSNIESCQFVGCDFSGAEIKGSSLKDSSFDGADFTGTLFKTCHFNKSTVSGARWVGTSFQHAGFSDMVFDGEMIDCAFEGISKTIRTVFRDMTFRNCFFKYCNLKKTRFENCRADNISLAFIKNNNGDISGITLLD